ncbi:MAG: hypothetical protein ACKO7B_19245, partial [Flavobacteriales bacterium]
MLIGQFTTCGDMNACINLQYKLNATGATLLQNNVCFSAVHPCLNEPLSTATTITNPCFENELATLDLNSGGNGAVNYSLYTTSDVLVDTYSNAGGVLQITDLNEGNFYITMEDAAGCRDTTADFNVTFPDPFLFEAVVTADELCFGENAGVIELQCSGGTGATAIQNAAGTAFFCSQAVDGLTCGNYTFTAEDQNNCVVTSTASISCPADLAFNPTVTNIDCFGDDDGIIFGTIFGGTGNLTAEWTRNGSAYQVIEGSAPLNINLTNLDEGFYTVTITDNNNCTLSLDLEVTEPDEITYELIVTDASCFSFCDGILDTSPTGGTGPFTISTINEQGADVNLSELCAGDYQVVIEDNAGCIVTDTISVGEPTEITFLTDTTDVTCFAQCDGEFHLFEVNGSAGGFTYDISPSIGANCTFPCAGTEATFTDLCSGAYTVTITSSDGCQKTASGPAHGNVQLAPMEGEMSYVNP